MMASPVSVDRWWHKQEVSWHREWRMNVITSSQLVSQQSSWRGRHFCRSYILSVLTLLEMIQHLNCVKMNKLGHTHTPDTLKCWQNLNDWVRIKRMIRIIYNWQAPGQVPVPDPVKAKGKGKGNLASGLSLKSYAPPVTLKHKDEEGL